MQRQEGSRTAQRPRAIPTEPVLNAVLCVGEHPDRGPQPITAWQFCGYLQGMMYMRRGGDGALTSTFPNRIAFFSLVLILALEDLSAGFGLERGPRFTL